MAKKATGTKKPSGEILDDNGTLIATSAGMPGGSARGADDDEASGKADKRKIPDPS
ncbi:MAG TPA: hypothetical protein VF688_15385 [Allosphingosinicella sp.]|jgi:hypothetical protein